MAVGIPTVEDAPVEGVTPDKPRVRPQVTYSQLLNVLERWRRRYLGFDCRETMVKLVVRAIIPYERSSGVGMMPATVDRLLDIPPPKKSKRPPVKPALMQASGGQDSRTEGGDITLTQVQQPPAPQLAPGVKRQGDPPSQPLKVGPWTTPYRGKSGRNGDRPSIPGTDARQ
jgi:hypothetical protein